MREFILGILCAVYLTGCPVQARISQNYPEQTNAGNHAHTVMQNNRGIDCFENTRARLLQRDQIQNNGLSYKVLLGQHWYEVTAESLLTKRSMYGNLVTYTLEINQGIPEYTLVCAYVSH